LSVPEGPDILDVVVRLALPSLHILRWSGWRRPAVRLGLTGLAAVAVIGAVGTVGGYVVPTLTAHDGAAKKVAGPATSTSPAPAGGLPGGGPLGQPSGTPSPSGSAAPSTGPATVSSWAHNLTRLGISQVALQAYGYAQVVTAQATPGCHLSWTTLAGIGKIESNHGTHGSSQLNADGKAIPPIYGPPLDGARGDKLIKDTDKGVLDNDKVYDRAVGPMQFLPGTWTKWGTDADDDGVADPQDINDAALSAARYLCANNHDLSTGAGWWQAIHSYNDLDKYASDVYAAADAYGVASQQG
jgi:hypothetical protein